MYKAKDIDTDKALKAIEESRSYQEKATQMRIEKEKSFLEGVNKGLDIAEGLFQCSNYEKDYENEEDHRYVDGILEVIDKLGKKLKIPTYDIKNNFSSVDEVCEELAERIRNQDRMFKNQGFCD